MRNRFWTELIINTSEEWREVRGGREFGMGLCACRERGNSEVYVFVYMHIQGQRVVIGRLCVRLSNVGRGLSLQMWPGARQYCRKHNARPWHKEIKFKIKKGWKCIIDSMCQLQNAIVIGIYSHTSQMITGAVQVIYCLGEGLTQWKSRGQGCKNPEVGILGNMWRNIGARQHICS